MIKLRLTLFHRKLTSCNVSSIIQATVLSLSFRNHIPNENFRGGWKLEYKSNGNDWEWFRPFWFWWDRHVYCPEEGYFVCVDGLCLFSALTVNILETVKFSKKILQFIRKNTFCLLFADIFKDGLLIVYTSNIGT